MSWQDLVRLHEEAVLVRILPKCPSRARSRLLKRAGVFFAEMTAPLEKTPSSARVNRAHIAQVIEALSRRIVELAAANLDLKEEIVRRVAAVDALRKSERNYSQLLSRSDRLQEELRRLSRQILSAQEEERKRISRELHDVIAQTLTGINVRLATLKKQAATDTRSLQQNIARTQRLVEESVDLVHRFARELRPAVLDDLGLIPALHSFVKGFAKSSHLRVRVTVFAAVETLDIAKRTVLYRVATEALTNVARHAQATQVDLSIRKLPDAFCMEVTDNGRSFDVERALHAKGNYRLGLLGMRERVEMVGGNFAVESVLGKGTTVQARIPFGKPARGGRKT
jgi:signal transduction histidine kinase